MMFLYKEVNYWEEACIYTKQRRTMCHLSSQGNHTTISVFYKTTVTVNFVTYQIWKVADTKSDTGWKLQLCGDT